MYLVLEVGLVEIPATSQSPVERLELRPREQAAPVALWRFHPQSAVPQAARLKSAELQVPLLSVRLPVVQTAKVEAEPAEIPAL